MIEEAAQFLALESQISSLEVVESHKLKEHQYEIVNTLRCVLIPLSNMSLPLGGLKVCFWFNFLLFRINQNKHVKETGL